ncbi:MAG: hypothetical protein H6677_17645 [Candidatus Obscuribacterales bacterium]|nr:hypothetical protein [Candidatus Obscuribacterales bacterium]
MTAATLLIAFIVLQPMLKESDNSKEQEQKKAIYRVLHKGKKDYHSPFPQKLQIGFTLVDGIYQSQHGSNDEDVARLVKTNAVHAVSMNMAELTPKAIEYLEGEPLEELSLINSALAPGVLKRISNLKNLKKLTLDKDSCIREKMFLELNGPAGLSDLDLSGTNVSDAELKHLISVFPHLDRLRLARCRNLTDDIFSDLTDLKELKELDITYIKCSEASLKALLAGTTGLQALRLGGSSITDDIIKRIRFSGIRSLHISKSPLTDSGIRAFKPESSLKKLVLDECPDLTDNSLTRLKKTRPDLALTLVPPKSTSKEARPRNELADFLFEDQLEREKREKRKGP